MQIGSEAAMDVSCQDRCTNKCTSVGDAIMRKVGLWDKKVLVRHVHYSHRSKRTQKRARALAGSNENYKKIKPLKLTILKHFK
jgi:hypothetical protein